MLFDVERPFLWAGYAVKVLVRTAKTRPGMRRASFALNLLHCCLLSHYQISGERRLRSFPVLFSFSYATNNFIGPVPFSQFSFVLGNSFEARRKDANTIWRKFREMCGEPKNGSFRQIFGSRDQPSTSGMETQTEAQYCPVPAFRRVSPNPFQNDCQAFWAKGQRESALASTARVTCGWSVEFDGHLLLDNLPVNCLHAKVLGRRAVHLKRLDAR